MDLNELTKAQRWEIANKLAEERLPLVNKIQTPAKPKTDTIYVKYVKRALDIIFSIVFLILSLPINLIIGIITLFDVGLPLFFEQERVGKNGKPFKIIKFRNMKEITDERGELLPAEQRVTKFGRFVRRTSLDELLNFWSILKGDMSIIGPRPLVPEYTDRYSDRHKARLSIKPGLECPPYDKKLRVRSFHEQFENDVWYVENVSFKVDCVLLVNLARIALFDRVGNKIRSMSSGGKGSFMGYDTEGRAISSKDVPKEYIDAYSV